MHLTLLTLGVRDLPRAIAFYEAMGLKRAVFESDEVAFFDMGGTALGLFGWDSLAGDAHISPEGSGFRGVTLAWNLPSEADVDAAVEKAVAAGARLVKKPEKVFWGGYSGYVADPDDHLWEIAFNPVWPLRENGAMDLPTTPDGSRP